MRFKVTGTVTVSAVAYVEAETEDEAREMCLDYEITHESMIRGMERHQLEYFIVDEFDGEVDISEVLPNG